MAGRVAQWLLSAARIAGSARCVWRGRDGDKIYSVLNGGVRKSGGSAEGTIVGGSGATEGIEGN